MKSVRFLNRQVSSSLTAFALLLSLALPGLIPAFASAEQVESRSIALSDSSAGADDAEYTVAFTAPTDGAEAYALQFCSNSPVIGASCTAPTGLDTAGVDTESAGSAVTTEAANFVVVTTTIDEDEDVVTVLTGIDNPDAAGTIYARIVTYDTTGHAEAYTATALGTGAIDEGGVALAITNEIGVTAAVRETMTFCVANQAITANCANAGDVGHEPQIELGEGTGDAKALSPSAVSTGSVYAQLSTNAVSGAVVNLKTNTTACGGLTRIGALSGGCGILPATSGSISNGEAKFGVRTGSSTSTAGVTDATGTLAPVSASGYNNSTYFFGYESGDTSGVTSPYGDPFIDSGGAPINNQNMQITFGASASNNTPAGTYAATLNMIATGTF